MQDITSDDNVASRSRVNCLPCRVSGSISFLLIAAYFYYGCKRVKPVYYVGIPSMLVLAVSRAFDLPPFNE
ncbi:Hypothetical protein CINCED_3A020469 [Cinara cedri]|uniref:Distal membrane-arm assembly complex protein 1-like domain-containing protein n=1 Tax=Cinara cedri TaxID=506608 RepID=A0A5E4NMZ6_9HEMI|nr:Hypothetical protein CINCED_3A020469 [Cinara cedri]